MTSELPARQILAVVLGGVLLCSGTQSHAVDSGGDQWQGRYQLIVFDFGARTQEVPGGPPEVYQTCLQTDFGYDVYQNHLGVVRYVLTRRTGARKDSLGDFASKLVDHGGGTVTLFLSPSTAYRGRLNQFPITTGRLESRRLLGFDCKGVEIRYEDSNHFKHVRQTWTAAQTTFKESLLEIGYIYDRDRSLRELTVGVITQFGKVQSIEPSLFEIPTGVSVSDESR